MNRAEIGAELKSSYNCCQAVMLAYEDELPFGRETIEIMGSTFGSGLGSMKGSCGALLGAETVLAFKMKQPKGMNRYSRELYQKFEDKCGASRCMDIKGIMTGEVLCSCEDCVRNAIEAVEEITAQ